MKKIIALMIAASAFSSSFAQKNDMEEARRIVLGEKKDDRSAYPSNNSKDVVLGTTRYPGKYPSTSRTSRTGRDDRRYEDRRRYNERSYDRKRDNCSEHNYKNKKYKSNNGKHLGWQKGKGNPHKHH